MAEDSVTAYKKDKAARRLTLMGGAMTNLKLLVGNTPEVSPRPSASEETKSYPLFSPRTPRTSLLLSGMALQASIPRAQPEDIRSPRAAANYIRERLSTPTPTEQDDKGSQSSAGTSSCSSASATSPLEKGLSLMLADYKLESIPEEVFQNSVASKLRHLDLGYNLLKALPETIGQLKNLKRLVLRSNQLCELPTAAFESLTKLRLLDLSYNLLTELPPTIGSLHKLEVLDVSHNKLKLLPPELTSLQALEVLDCSHNALISIANIEIARHAQLQELFLASNMLEELPATITDCLAIQTLDISDNRIAELPRVLAEMPSLRVFRVAGNPVCERCKFDNGAAVLEWLKAGGDEAATKYMLGSDLQAADSSSTVLSTDSEHELSADMHSNSSAGLPDDSAAGQRADAAGSDVGQERPCIPRAAARKQSVVMTSAVDINEILLEAKDQLRREAQADGNEEDVRLAREADELLGGATVVSVRISSEKQVKKQMSIQGTLSFRRKNTDGRPPLIKSVPEFRLELGKEQTPWRQTTEERISLSDYDSFFDYQKYFKGHGHVNWIGRDPKRGTVVISILKTPETQREDAENRERNNEAAGSNAVALAGNAFYRGLIRSKQGDMRLFIPQSLVRVSKSSRNSLHYVSSNSLLKAARHFMPELGEITGLRTPKSPQFLLEYARMEERIMPSGYKFGVLYAKANQTSDDEFFNNEHGSPEFEEFLEFLGTKIELKGWKGYRAGLDVRSDSTGRTSVYTKFHGYEIMFHVSTLLPYFPKDPQQVERKRHLGNDIVVIVWKDYDPASAEEFEPFNPAKVSSHFNHVYAVVSVDRGGGYERKPGTTYYRLGLAYKEGVRAPIPILTHSVFEKGPEFREFLLTKLINAERCAYSAPGFKSVLERTRQLLLQSLESL